MKTEMISKYIISNIIDLGIPLFPVVIGYFYKHLAIFNYLGFFELLAIVFLIFTLISLIGSKGNTVGSNIVKIQLIEAKTEKVSLIKNLFRIIIITGLIFLIGDLNNLDKTILFLFILVIVPIPIKSHDNTFLSVLNRALGIKYDLA